MKSLTEQQINEIIGSYEKLDPLIEPDREPWASQYDPRSAVINYAMVRHYKPKVVVEFGARGGRCTHDILKALIANGVEYVLKSYELEDSNRRVSNENLKRAFGDKAVIVGADIMEAKDIPDNIDYLFIDNYHDEKTTRWVFDTLIKKCKPGCLVHFHDLLFKGTMEGLGRMDWGEQAVMLELHKAGKLPIKKLYWTADEGNGQSSTWWIYEK